MLLEPEIVAVGFSPEQRFRSNSLRPRDRDSGDHTVRSLTPSPVR